MFTAILVALKQFIQFIYFNILVLEKMCINLSTFAMNRETLTLSRVFKIEQKCIN